MVAAESAGCDVGVCTKEGADLDAGGSLCDEAVHPWTLPLSVLFFCVVAFDEDVGGVTPYLDPCVSCVW